jgi:adenylate kinase family enzyme
LSFELISILFFDIIRFPRTEENLATFLNWKGGEVVCALAIDAPDEVLTKRLMGRGASSGRWDDKDAKVIAKRLENFHAQTVPVIKHYEVSLRVPFPLPSLLTPLIFSLFIF